MGCRKDTGTGPDGGDGNGEEQPPITYTSADSTRNYFGLSGVFVYRDSTYIFSSSSFTTDTVKRTFLDTSFVDPKLYVPFKDSLYASGRVNTDTFEIRAETLYLNISISWDTTYIGSIRYLYGVRPLSVGQSWTPVNVGTYPLSGTIVQPDTTNNCTTYVYFDSLKVDSSFAQVLAQVSFSTPLQNFTDVFQNLYRVHSRIFIHTVGTGSGCYTLQLYALTDVIDTTYIKDGYGIVGSTSLNRISIPLLMTDSTTTHRVLVGR